MDPLLEGLDATQREAVTSPAAPLAILAGAGSGKTRVLTRRIAWQASHGALEPSHALAVTFTRKAAGELRARLTRLGVRQSVTAGTFHAIALAQLRRRAADQGRSMPGLLERKVRLLVPMMPGRGSEAGLQAADIAAEIEWAKARLVRPEGYEVAVASAGRVPPRSPSEVATLYTRYEREKRKRGVVDFDDLIWSCADLLERDAEFAATSRWRFRHLFVDEFQDASAAQFRLLLGWLGDRAELCVVGDPDQAIYGFAGADPSHLTSFKVRFPVDRFPAVGVVRLGSNYRSSPQVVAAASAVLGARPQAVRSARPEGPSPSITAYPTDEAEAAGVARALRDSHGPDRGWARMAVLYRVNAQSALFEEALSRAGIPYRVRGNGRFLDRPEVKVALDALRAAAKQAPGRRFAEHLADLTEDAAGLPEERREHADALARLGREYLEAEGGTGSVDGFLAFLHAALRGDDDAGVSGDAVELLTFHRAKGLEWDTVFVTGLERGLVPISHAKTTAALDEEQRLLYVALSRAERALHVSWARERTMGLRTLHRNASPWLARIERALDPGGDRPPRTDVATRLREAREKVARAGAGSSKAARSKTPTDPADSELMAALVEWRRRLARASGVPAYVIFHDTTLAALVTARPSTPAELLTVAGVGPVKAERYGEAVLALVRDAAPASAR